MKQSPNNVRFEELDGFLKRQGFERRQRGRGGSHFVYKREDGVRLTIAKPHGGRKTLNRATIRDVLEKLEL